MSRTAWLLLILAATGGAIAAPDHPLSGAHRKWLEQEVVYIIADPLMISPVMACIHADLR